MDPRDRRSDADWFDVVASEEGVFGCVGMMACEDVCPKELPLLEVHAYLRRRMLSSQLHRRDRGRNRT
jgi:fumarate reductase iron-sulfur subunit